MRKLELVGLDVDGRHVVLVDESGVEYAVPADDRLRAALRGDRARLGQLEIDMNSALRPRDIQARIRAGESPDSVATVAQVTVDKIMPYCVPVLAERRHIAELARRHHVRRKNADGPARTLDSVVTERLRSRGIEPASADWDAWRRDDGRWAVRAAYQSGGSEHAAAFVFDAIGRYSLADDDEARWLTGEQQTTRKGPQPRESGTPGERRLSSVRAGDDLLSLSGVDRAGDDEQTDDLTAVVRAVREPEHAGRDAPAAETHPTGVPASSAPASDAPPGSGDAAAEPLAAGDVHQDSATSAGGAEPPGSGPDESLDSAPTDGTVVETPPGRGRRSPRRASVPSWDEIMFGAAKDDDR